MMKFENGRKTNQMERQQKRKVRRKQTPTRSTRLVNNKNHWLTPFYHFPDFLKSFEENERKEGRKERKAGRQEMIKLLGVKEETFFLLPTPTNKDSTTTTTWTRPSPPPPPSIYTINLVCPSFAVAFLCSSGCIYKSPPDSDEEKGRKNFIFCPLRLSTFPAS